MEIYNVNNDNIQQQFEAVIKFHNNQTQTTTQTTIYDDSIDYTNDNDNDIIHHYEQQHHQQQQQQHQQHYQQPFEHQELASLEKNSDGDADDDWTKICNIVYDSKLSQNFLEFWICGIILNCVAILGILGNVVSMCILSRPQMRSSINYLLVGLGICDTVLIIASMLVFGIPCIYPYTGYLFLYYNYVYPFIAPLVFPISMIAQTSSIYMTFIVTLERYVAVCHPLKARALCTYGRAKIYFISCVIFSTCYNITRFWEVLIVSYQPADSPVKLHCVRPTMLRRNPLYIKIYINWCYMIVNFVIPLLLLAILNCLIYRQVRLANRERQRLTRTEKREIGLATMLLFIVVVFLCLNSLALVINISEAFYDFIDPALTKISNLMVTINSSCNFVIYVLYGEKFRRIFCQIFFKRWHKPIILDNMIPYDSSTSNNDETIIIKYKQSGRFSRQSTARSTVSSLSPTTTKVNSIRSQRFTAIDVPVVYYPKRDWQRDSSNILGKNNNDWLENINPKK